MANHARFEMLCTLEASGQLTNTELAELREHCDSCVACSRLLAEMTQISARLFSAHALRQPKIRMPENILERFIARANNEGIALSPRAASHDIGAFGLTAALVLALLLVSATLHLGLSTKSAGKTSTANVPSPSGTFGGERSDLPKAPAGVHSLEARRPSATNQRNASSIHQRAMLLASREPGLEKQIETSSPVAESTQFDLTIYSRNQTMFSRPFLSEINLDQMMLSSSAQYRVPRLNIGGPSASSRDEPPQLFAEYEHLAIAPWNPQNNFAPEPPDAQALRRDFDPDARGALLSSDLKGRLPAFQFARESNQ